MLGLGRPDRLTFILVLLPDKMPLANVIAIFSIGMVLLDLFVGKPLANCFKTTFDPFLLVEVDLFEHPFYLRVTPIFLAIGQEAATLIQMQEYAPNLVGFQLFT